MRHSSARFFWLYAIFPAVACLAQPHTVRGVVEDATGTAVADARVVLYRTGTSTPAAETTSTGEGRFAFPAESGRTYLVEVTAPGFATTAAPVTADAPARIPLRLSTLSQNVLVTAEASPQTIDQISKPSSIVTREEIEQRDEASITEALRNTPGLMIRQLGGPGQAASIRMRGLRADATAVLIDGLRFRDVATIQGDASGFLSTLNVVNVDRVEVLRGSGSSLYGSNAVGGVINVLSDTGGGSTRASVLTEGGSLGWLRARANASGSFLHNKLTWSTGLLHLNVLDGVDANDRARSSGLQQFLRYSPSGRVSLSGRVFISDDFVQSNISPSASGIPAANIPNSLIVPAIPLASGEVRKSELGLPFTPGNATFIPGRDDPDSRRASRFYSTALIFRAALTPELDLQASYQHLYTHRVFMNGPAGLGFQPTTSNDSLFDGTIDTPDARLTWHPARWFSLTGGAEFEHESYLNTDDNRLPRPETVRVRTEAAQRSTAGWFASQTALLNGRLQVSLSGRVQNFTAIRPKFDYAGTADTYSSGATLSPPRALTGDAAVSYFIGRTGTKLRAHGGNSYRAPGLYERYGTGFYYDTFSNAVVFSPYGDPRLAPDRYNSVDAGIDQYLLGDKVRLSATWYYTRIVQITQFDFSTVTVNPATDPYGRYSGYYNGAGGISRGAELTVETRPFRSSLVRASYSYTNAATDQDSGVRGFWRALSIPTHIWSAFWHQNIGRKTDATLDMSRAGEYYNALSAAGRTRAYLYPGATRVDAVLSRRILDRERYSVHAYVKGDNILNRRYFENGFQAARATYITGLRIRFR